MKKRTVFVILMLAMLMLAACSEQPKEKVYESSQLSWYEMLGDWDQVGGDNYLELFDDDTFYDSRYDLTGVWDESQDEGDVVFYYNAVPDYILNQGWPEDEVYYECYGYDYGEDVLFDVETNEARWRKH